MTSSFFDNFYNKANHFHIPFLKVQCLEGKTNASQQNGISVEERKCITKSNNQSSTVPENTSCEFGSTKYFVLCGFGGVLSCGITHTALVPLDLVKCRIQVDPLKYKSIFNGFGVTIREEGGRALAKGWSPTMIGYSMQGLCKFGFYEVFKTFYSSILGEEPNPANYFVHLKPEWDSDRNNQFDLKFLSNFLLWKNQNLAKVLRCGHCSNVVIKEKSYLWRTSLYLASSASAEFLADIALCPMEACKVRIQLQPGFASTLREAFPKMKAQEGLSGFYKGIIPLWGRQIPYTMMKFACFERTVEAIYTNVVPKPRSECSKFEQLAVTFVAGYIAGIFCAVVSHPADSVVSVLNKDKGSTAMEALKKLGPKGIWKGLFARIIMIGTLTALQWFIYDSVKVYFRMPRPPPPEMPESLREKFAIQQQ